MIIMEFKSKIENKVLKGRSREIVNLVIKFMKEEAQAGTPLIPLAKVQERVSAATGVSIRTIRTISREADDVQNGKRSCFRTPNKKRSPRKTKTDLDDLYKCILRRLVTNCYLTDKKVPTIRQIHKKFCDETGYKGSLESLRKVTISLGLRWRETKTNSKILMEEHHTHHLRSSYLHSIKWYKEQNRQVIFMDATYLHLPDIYEKDWNDKSNENLKKSIGEEARLIIVHAGSESGFVPGAYIRWKSIDSNEIDFTNYKNWIQKKLIPNLSPYSVVVIANVPYHNKEFEKWPTSALNKEDMRRWLHQKNIIYQDYMTKSELYNLIKLHKPLCKTYEIDLLFNEYGHDVLRLPPYHPDLNPIELIWESLKRYVADQQIVTFNLDIVEALSDRFFNEFPASEWKSCCEHINKIEQDFISKEQLLNKVVDDNKFNEDSDSDSEEYISDS